MIDLKKYNIPIPRYTSYPPASSWGKLDHQHYLHALSSIQSPISLYIHIPFCFSRCLYCGCSSISFQSKEESARYIDALCRELELIQKEIGRAPIKEIHFGGGSPSLLSTSTFEQIFSAIKALFCLEESAEISIEVDPRNVYNTKKLEEFKKLGFNRLSLGIQDLDSSVQKEIGRFQPANVSKGVFLQARELGFSHINIDLVYGLPRQTLENFITTIEEISAWQPERIALFSFAYLPEIKPNQRSIPQNLLPSPEEKFAIYQQSREHLLKKGYAAIGIDHFALTSDSLSHALKNKTLRRGFQGYTPGQTGPLIGLGITSISSLETAYFQNTKDLSSYLSSIENNALPTSRGSILSDDDLIRRWVIEQILCFGSIDKSEFKTKWDHSFDEYFANVDLDSFIQDDLLKETQTTLCATDKGSLLLRNIASCFDPYTHTICSGAI